MAGLSGRLIVLGVSGSIAAYKVPDLAQRFRNLGAAVQVVMTRSATRLVAPSIFHAISGNPVIEDLFEVKEFKDPMPHIKLAREASLTLVAPATANIIGKLANGIADDALSTVLISTRAPIVLAPAMHDSMWRDPATQENIQKLKGRGATVIAPEWGSLASGDVGEGRMADLEKIAAEVLRKLSFPVDLEGVRCLITAGGTRESIDPVRFIGNRSSGKMGVALARVAMERGAEVVLVCGAMTVDPPGGARLVRTETAEEMERAVRAEADRVNVIIMAAAVSDFRPKLKSPRVGKKKRGGVWNLRLESTPDILQELAGGKDGKIVVGFAAETENVKENARAKLQHKNLDMIVANDVTQPGAGFESDTNIVSILTREGDLIELPRLSKEEVAQRIWDQVALRLRDR